MTYNSLILAAKTLDAGLFDDSSDNWKTINGARVHLDEDGQIDGGAGGKLTGKKIGEDWRAGERSALMRAAEMLPQKKPEVKPKAKRKNVQERLIDHINKQLGVDVSQYRDRKYEMRGMVNLDWGKMPRNLKSKIVSLALQYKKFDIHDNGGLGVSLLPHREGTRVIVPSIF